MTHVRATRLDAVVRRLPLYGLGAFALVAVLIAVISAVAYQHPAFTFLDGPSWLDAQFHGDSGWYYGIAKHGYFYVPGQQSSVAFFPVYPFLIRTVGNGLGLEYSTAAGLITLVCGAGVVVLFADWIRTRVQPRAALAAVAIFLLYPYSFFLYGSGYSDASYLLTVLGSFALLERRHYVLAGLVGALATAGRPVGVAVAVGLVVRGVELLAQDRATHRSDPETEENRPPAFATLIRAVPFARWREATLVLSGAGLLAWMIYLGTRFHDPLAFASVQSAPGWNQGSGPHTWFKVVFAGTLYHRLWHNIFLLVPQALACLAAVLLVHTTWRRFGWGYTAYAAISLAIPIIGTKDFMGAGRYVLAAYPVLAAAAIVLTGPRRPRWLAPLVLVFLTVGLCIATVSYVHGVEVS